MKINTKEQINRCFRGILIGVFVIKFTCPAHERWVGHDFFEYVVSDASIA